MNPCGVAHLKSTPCRSCERLRLARTSKPHINKAREAVKEVREVREAMTAAERQRAYRERKKATDPDYLKREAARKREAR